MSLKAKIEAVIYASEEPVTLAQLIGLLGQEAQVELDHRDNAQQALPLEGLVARADGSDDIDAEDVLAMAEGVESEPGPVAVEAIAQTPEPEAEVEAEAAEVPEKDEKQLAREEKDRARRLRDYFRSLVDQLIADYASEANDRGLEIREVAGGFRLATKPEYHDAVRGFVKSLKPPLKLSLQALETLAVVAYKQPVTAPEISEIRGVDSGGVLGSLMTRKLITTAGRKQVIGRPILYKTTRDFLLRFGLKDVSELPSIEEFEKMAGELADAESVQEEIPMTPTQTNQHVEEPQADGDPSPLAASESPTPDGKPTDSPAVRLTGTPPASVIPGTDEDPTEAGAIARENERDREERTFPQEGSKPSLQPK